MQISQATSWTVTFRVVLASDGSTPAVGKTLNVTISKNGGAFGTPSGTSSGHATEVGNGNYSAVLNATDTATIGPLVFQAVDSAATVVLFTRTFYVVAVTAATSAPTTETFTGYYTSQAEIERMMSAQGAAANVQDYQFGEAVPSDDSTTQADVWDDVCCAATDELAFYLLRYHSQSDLAKSRWVRMRATWVACHLLSQRRGNPGIFQSLYEKAITECEMVNETRPVPRLGINASLMPSMSNIRIDQRYSIALQRVQPTISVGKAYPGQQLDPDCVMEPWPY